MKPATMMWHGVVVSIQPRIRLTRSFDQRTHSYLGYVVQPDGAVDDESRTFAIAISEAAHAKHRIQSGDALRGAGEPVADPRTETAPVSTKRGPSQVLSGSAGLRMIAVTCIAPFCPPLGYSAASVTAPA